VEGVVVVAEEEEEEEKKEEEAGTNGQVHSASVGLGHMGNEAPQ
jgi:hypothetical protein